MCIRDSTYTHLQEVFDKLTEELRELEEASTPEHQKEEMGDVLFVVAEIARMLKIDAEEALREANHKFKRRFQKMEALSRDAQKSLESHTIAEWVQLWQTAKIEA